MGLMFQTHLKQRNISEDLIVDEVNRYKEERKKKKEDEAEVKEAIKRAQTKRPKDMDDEDEIGRNSDSEGNESDVPTTSSTTRGRGRGRGSRGGKTGETSEGGAPEGGGGVEGAEEEEARLLWSRLPVPLWMPLGLRDLDQDRAVKIPPGKNITNFFALVIHVHALAFYSGFQPVWVRHLICQTNLFAFIVNHFSQTQTSINVKIKCKMISQAFIFSFLWPYLGEQ